MNVEAKLAAIAVCAGPFLAGCTFSAGPDRPAAETVYREPYEPSRPMHRHSYIQTIDGKAKLIVEQGYAPAPAKKW